MFKKTAVGDKIYVWTIGDKRNNEAVISAHGGQSIINSTFPVPKDMSFVFYGPHNYLLQDPGLLNVIYGEIATYDTVSAGACQDYTLSKFQGAKHGGGTEKYSDIENFGITDEELRAQMRAQKPPKTEEQINAFLNGWVKRPRNDLDIITVRNRRFSADPTLSEVVAELIKSGYKYSKIHCAFCRGPSLPWKQDAGTYVPPKLAA